MLEFTIFTAFLGLIPPVLIYFLKKNKSFEVELLKPFIFLLAFSSVYEFVFSFLLKVNVTLWFRIYSLLEMFILMLFFYKLTKGKYKILQSLYLVIYILLFILVFVISNKYNFDKGDSYLSVLEFLFIVSFSLIWFKNLFTDLTIESLWDSPIFYFLTGLVLYFSGTTFLFLLSEIISKESQENFAEYWILNVILAFIFRILLIVGIWKGQVK